MPNGEKIVETKATAETPNADKKPFRNRLCRRWECECTWNSYFPYWRSVLALRSPIKVYPAHAQTDELPPPKFDRIQDSVSKFGKLSTTSVPKGNACLLAREIPQVTNMHRSRRLFGTVALTMLKVLKNA